MLPEPLGDPGALPVPGPPGPGAGTVPVLGSKRGSTVVPGVVCCSVLVSVLLVSRVVVSGVVQVVSGVIRVVSGVVVVSGTVSSVIPLSRRQDDIEIAKAAVATIGIKTL